MYACMCLWNWRSYPKSLQDAFRTQNVCQVTEKVAVKDLVRIGTQWRECVCVLFVIAMIPLSVAICVDLCMCVCMHACMHACMYACVMNVYMYGFCDCHVWSHVWSRVSAYVMYVYVYIQTIVCTCVCMHEDTHHQRHNRLGYASRNIQSVFVCMQVRYVYVRICM
jgi:hypothetical protein